MRPVSAFSSSPFFALWAKAFGKGCSVMEGKECSCSRPSKAMALRTVLTKITTWKGQKEIKRSSFS